MDASCRSVSARGPGQSPLTTLLPLRGPVQAAALYPASVASDVLAAHPHISERRRAAPRSTSDGCSCAAEAGGLERTHRSRAVRVQQRGARAAPLPAQPAGGRGLRVLHGRRPAAKGCVCAPSCPLPPLAAMADAPAGPQAPSWSTCGSAWRSRPTRAAVWASSSRLRSAVGSGAISGRVCHD
jgi:hypothetical protein